MARQLFISVIFMTLLMSFQNMKPADEISGIYLIKSECCGYFSDEIQIKKNCHYKRVYSLNNFEQIGKWTITGTWILKNDTLILTPVTVKNHINSKNNSANMYNTDTLIYKKQALQTFKGSMYKK